MSVTVLLRQQRLTFQTITQPSSTWSSLAMLHPEGEGTALMFPKKRLYFIQNKLPRFLGLFHIFITVFHNILKTHMHLRLKMNSDVCDTSIGHDHKHPDSTVYFKGVKKVDENFLRLTTCVL